jgi:DUF4097 and DUF4098 domain-containing protein YvlB
MALAFSAHAHAQEATEEFHHTYPIAANGTVDISNVNGRVRITGTDANEVKVDAIKRGDSKQKLDDARIEVNSTANEFDLRTRYPNHDSWFGGYRNPASVEYTIAVPKGVRLRASVVNSPLEISGVTGDVKASTVNAEVTVSGLASSADVSTVNSRAEADFNSLPSSGHIRVHSVNGTAIVAIPAGSNADVRARSVNGSIHNDFNLQVDRPRYGPGSRLEGKIGNGGPEIELETVNGGIQIRQH